MALKINGYGPQESSRVLFIDLDALVVVLEVGEVNDSFSFKATYFYFCFDGSALKPEPDNPAQKGHFNKVEMEIGLKMALKMLPRSCDHRQIINWSS